jgi:hypothetical protein
MKKPGIRNNTIAGCPRRRGRWNTCHLRRGIALSDVGMIPKTGVFFIMPCCTLQKPEILAPNASINVL